MWCFQLSVAKRKPLRAGTGTRSRASTFPPRNLGTAAYAAAVGVVVVAAAVVVVVAAAVVVVAAAAVVVAAVVVVAPAAVVAFQLGERCVEK